MVCKWRWLIIDEKDIHWGLLCSWHSKSCQQPSKVETVFISVLREGGWGSEGPSVICPRSHGKGKRQGLSPAVPCPGPFSSIVWYPQCSPGLFFHIICALKRSYVLLRYLKWTEYHISWALTCDLLSFNQTFLLPGHQAIQYLEAICLKTSDFVFRKCEHILHIFYKTPDFSLSLCRLLPISECSENGNNR